MRAATGDRREVQRILTNLLGNALKFTRDGGHVELAGWFDGSTSVIAVRDDGPGIAVEDRARIFERFYRVDAHAAISGTGLGLAIARDLARAMGGDLAVASVQESGSSFVLVLPGPRRCRRRVDRRRPRACPGRRGGPPRGGRRAARDPLGRPADRPRDASSRSRCPRRRPSPAARDPSGAAARDRWRPVPNRSAEPSLTRPGPTARSSPAEVPGGRRDVVERADLSTNVDRRSRFVDNRVDFGSAVP